MKNSPLQSILESSLDRMFVTDKRGRRIFFPLEDRKPGYLIKSKSLEGKLKKFYTSSFFICLAIILISAAIFQGFWGIAGSMIVGFGSLYFIQQFYISRIVKSLPIANVKLKDILLEQYESDDAEEPSESELQVP